MNIVTIIVNYRTADLTIDCLRSLEPIANENPGFSVELIDGGSADDSPEQLSQAIEKHHWQSWVHFTQLSDNKGFAGSNNVGIQAALDRSNRPDAIWLLNPDTIVRTGALNSLVETLHADASIGLVGSRLEHRDGEVQISTFRYPTILSELVDSVRCGVISRLFAAYEVSSDPPAQACAVPWVAGASLIIKTEVFDEIGLLDDGYFMYFEEVDFCHRAESAGYSCWYQPESRVVHLVGQSSGVTGQSATLRRRPAYWFDSRRRYFLSKHGVFKTAVADAVWLCGRVTWNVRAVLQRKPAEDPPRLWRDFLSHSIFVRGTG
ncbi:N-acetylglucosaminyl-diphospho-decaprenol L-rhamnosyltransferase [Planctomycetes bacterium CA13]|uniref:N-acetylglucosaminyl-diphospho-decaprenol L-rhamnosyltransferase n=1 Tax=Novipirellula herctigrandis TaxID=2527986 RepID=A0A5C5Z3L0_9BACT|nr:N-acetylglucosaminyl-diphospho-decaprenol L-rhamnosyltransferase [Planctomycetes bacterium CA13]